MAKKKSSVPELPRKYSTIIITVTTLFEDSIFYKPAETFMIRTNKEYKVNAEIEKFLKKLSKQEGKETYTLAKLGEE